MATVIPGPIDALSEGIMAGAKLAHLGASLKNQRVANELARSQLALEAHRMNLEDMLAPSRIALGKSQADLMSAQAKRIEEGLAQGEVEAEVESKRAGTAATKAGTKATEAGMLSTLAKVSSDKAANVQAMISASLDPTPTMEESKAFITSMIPALQEQLGVTVKEGDPTYQFYVTKFFNESQQLAEKLRIEELQADALAGYRAGMLDVNQQRANQQDPVEAADLEIITSSIKEAEKTKSMYEATLPHLATKPELLKEFQKSIDALDERIISGRRELMKKRKAQLSDANAVGGGGANGAAGAVPAPTTQEEYKLIPKGSKYQHPDDPPGEYRIKGES